MADWREELSEAGRIIVTAVEGLATAGSQVEARAWAVMLADALTEAVKQADVMPLTMLLNQLQQHQPELHELIIPWVEAASTKYDVDRSKTTYQLMVLPVLAWSRFSIPAGVVPLNHLETIYAVLAEHVFANGVSFSLANKWFSPEQLPDSYHAAWALLQQLSDKRPLIDVAGGEFPAPEQFLCDVRYLVLKVKLPRNGALFVWQQPPLNLRKELVAAEVEALLKPLLSAALPGCVVRAMMPDALFTAWKTADMSARHYAIAAAATFLSMSLEVSVEELIATVAIFERDGEEEIRVGFTADSLPGIQYGLIWPLWGDDLASQLQVVAEELGKLGLQDVVHFSSTYSALEDDGFDSPAYVDVDGQVVEAVMPESVSADIRLH